MPLAPQSPAQFKPVCHTGFHSTALTFSSQCRRRQLDMEDELAQNGIRTRLIGVHSATEGEALGGGGRRDCALTNSIL